MKKFKRIMLAVAIILINASLFETTDWQFWVVPIITGMWADVFAND